MKHKEKLILCLAAGLLTTNMMAQNAPKLNANNIDEVVKAMTLEEKASLLIGATSQAETSGAMVGATKKLVAGAAGTTTAIPRLGIPATVLTDGPAGVRIDPTRKGETKTYYATGFPIGTALACTWNTPLVEQVGKAIGNEVLEYGCDVILGPGMNIHRNPLCGRNFEYYSEDPILCGKIAAAYVRGVQSQGVGTSIKHFAVNSQETNRTGVDERVSQRALREIYLRGFEIAVRESQPWTVMSSYNKINGTFTQESRDCSPTCCATTGDSKVW
jgi:beta-glucosidase